MSGHGGWGIAAEKRAARWRRSIPGHARVAGPCVRWSLQPGHTGHPAAGRPPAERYGQQYAPWQQAQEWTPLPLQDYETQPVLVAPKSPAGSVLLSIFVPGLGSMVNDNAGVGVTILILNIIGWILAIVLIGIPLALGSWIWGLVDAYQSAQRWNRAHGIVS